MFAAARAWVTEPIAIYPWTCGVAGLVLFLIGALSARRAPRRAAIVAGSLFIAAFVLALVLGRAASNCT